MKGSVAHSEVLHTGVAGAKVVQNSVPLGVVVRFYWKDMAVDDGGTVCGYMWVWVRIMVRVQRARLRGPRVLGDAYSKVP